MTDVTNLHRSPKAAEPSSAAPPPPGSRLRLAAQGSLRDAVVAAYRSIVDYALVSAARASVDPVTAVHETRKALRRARAIVRLVAEELPEGLAEQIIATLRDAARAVSEPRDRAVVPQTLTALPLEGDLAEAAQQVATAVRAAAAADTAQAISRLLAEAMAAVGPTGAAFEAGLVAVDWRLVRRGLRRSFRRAARARLGAGRTDDTTHDWRKRIKDLTYGLELLAGEHEGAARGWRRLFADLSELLGEAIDLAVARDLALARRGELGDLLAERLAFAINEELQARRRAARKLGKQLFRKRPRRFARKVIRDVRDAREPDDELGADSHNGSGDPGAAPSDSTPA